MPFTSATSDPTIYLLHSFKYHPFIHSYQFSMKSLFLHQVIIISEEFNIFARVAIEKERKKKESKCTSASNILLSTNGHFSPKSFCAKKTNNNNRLIREKDPQSILFQTSPTLVQLCINVRVEKNPLIVSLLLVYNVSMRVLFLILLLFF